MLGNLNGWHLVIILAIVLLLFGAPKLPALARSIGQSMRIFRSEVKTMKDENGNDIVVEDAAAAEVDAHPAHLEHLRHGAVGRRVPRRRRERRGRRALGDVAVVLLRRLVRASALASTATLPSRSFS
jgi:sec-independent protein translocase protein TatA